MRCIAWLWSLTEKKGKVRFITALAISAFTSVLLLVNPTLSAKLVDDVIVAQNPEPLLGILAVMLAVGLRPVLWKLLLLVILQWCTSPLSGHMLAQFEYRVNQNLEQHLELPDGEQEAGQ